MTDRQAKHRTRFLLALWKRLRLRNKGSLFKPLFPEGAARQLIWFEHREEAPECIHYTAMPVLVDKYLPDKCLEIEERPNFVVWGINPWTGIMADIKFNF